jgi:hypothetical protein
MHIRKENIYCLQLSLAFSPLRMALLLAVESATSLLREENFEENVFFLI